MSTTTTPANTSSEATVPDPFYANCDAYLGKSLVCACGYDNTPTDANNGDDDRDSFSWSSEL